MIPIKPIEIPTKGIGKYFDIDCIRIKIKSDSQSTPTFVWSVMTEVVEEPSEADEQVVKYPGETILQGNIQMTLEEYAMWSNDDNYVIDWGLEKLGFIRL